MKDVHSNKAGNENIGFISCKWAVQKSGFLVKPDILKFSIINGEKRCEKAFFKILVFTNNR